MMDWSPIARSWFHSITSAANSEQSAISLGRLDGLDRVHRLV